MSPNPASSKTEHLFPVGTRVHTYVHCLKVAQNKANRNTQTQMAQMT